MSVAVADVNGDGKPDLVVANMCGASACGVELGSVAVLLGNGDGTFQTAVTYSSGAYEALSVAVADVNNDGKPDLLVTNACPTGQCAQGSEGQVGVLLGNGDGTFQTAVTYGTGGFYADSVAVADVNGDGKPDLVIANACTNTACYGSDGGQVGVLLGNGDGTFQTAVAYGSGGNNAYSAQVEDVNGDDKPDVLVVNNCVSQNCPNGAVGVLLGNGDGTFQTVVLYDSGGAYPLSMAVADVNGDSKPDLLVANCGVNCATGTGSVGVLLGNGDGTFQTAVVYSSGGYAAYSIAVADVNGDGKPDLEVDNLCVDSNCLTGSAGVLLGNGDGTFQTAVTYGSGGNGAYSIAVADVNGDSLPDMILANKCADSTCSADGVGGVLINSSKPATITTLASSPNPSNFGQTVSFTASVTPQSGNGTPTGTVSFYDGTTNIGSSPLNGGFATLRTATLPAGTQSMTATYNGDAHFAPSTSPVVNQVVQAPIVTLSPTNLSFGSQNIGTTSAPQVVLLTNTGNLNLTMSSIQVTGPNSGDFAQTNNCPASLLPSNSCSISVTFTPAAAGTRSAALNITDSAPNSPQIVALAGIGNGASVTLSPLGITFPSQYVGTSGLPQTVTVTNTGTSTLTITNVAASKADFGTLSNCSNAVPPGANCTIGVFFDPTTSGTRNGILIVTDNAADSPQSVPLSGAGQDFSMAPSGSPTATISPGQNVNYTVAVAPAGGFSQTVSLSCSGAPAGATCSVPGSVTLNGSGSTPVKVTVTTATTSGGLMRPGILWPGGARLAMWLGLFGLPGLVILGTSNAGRRHRSHRVIYALAFACLFSLAITSSGCGGGNGGGGNSGGGGVSAGTYNLTVTGSFTSGSSNLKHAANLTLVVQ
jgi:hypothetical protein